MAEFMAYWGFTYNIPMVMNNFFYTVMILLTFVGVFLGVFAARAHKKAEAFMPVNEEYEAKKAERLAKKALKKEKPAQTSTE